ncbi:MAG TPA: hypothetical protein VFT43_12140, partial [Candidatus Polarisedimenticolia bacterium]|nr:hypothetical protein [Candidatus Polarisedimenticolia bacterium]
MAHPTATRPLFHIAGRLALAGACGLALLVGETRTARAGDEAAPAPLRLEEAERRAIAASPLIRAAGERVRFEEGRLRQAGIYPNPDLSL